MKTFALILVLISAFMWIRQVSLMSNVEDAIKASPKIEQDIKEITEKLGTNVDVDRIYSIAYWIGIITKMIFYAIVIYCLI